VLLRGRKLTAAVERRVLRNGFIPDVVVEPIPVGLLQRLLRLGLVYAVAEAAVENHARLDVLVLQTTIQLVTVWHRYALVVAALLNQRRRFRLLDGGDRRSLGVNLRIIPRRGVQILPGERRLCGMAGANFAIGSRQSYDLNVRRAVA